MTITREEAAQALDGNQYREEGSRELFQRMKEAGLVAVFGASDDLTEFRGAIADEAGSSTVYLDKNGIIQSECDEGPDCPYFKRLLKNAATIKPVWSRGDFAWQYETTIPHSTFIIYEDDDKYCKGIVFALADIVLP